MFENERGGGFVGLGRAGSLNRTGVCSAWPPEGGTPTCAVGGFTTVAQRGTELVIAFWNHSVDLGCSELEVDRNKWLGSSGEWRVAGKDPRLAPRRLGLV